jgi:AcrR family transcriptional regulator
VSDESISRENATVVQESYARRRRIPSQRRSRETVEAICAAASAIIEEEGLTALTTNGVAKRAGVSITAVYAYFPDKWAIVHELFERFERMRVDYLEEQFAGIATTPDWRSTMHATWDALVRFRLEVPAGIPLRQAISATPQLRQIDLDGTERASRDLAAAMLVRRPDLATDAAQQAAWTATIAAGALLDDACRTGEVDSAKLEEGKRLLTDYLAPYLDPAP